MARLSVLDSDGYDAFVDAEPDPAADPHEMRNRVADPELREVRNRFLMCALRRRAFWPACPR